MALSRRRFLTMFVAATAAIVADPKVLVAETSRSTTQLAPSNYDNLIANAVKPDCDLTITPVRDEMEMHALAQMMSQFALNMSVGTGIPERMLFGRGGAPTEDQYYNHIMEQQTRWHEAWCSRTAGEVVEQMAQRYNKKLEITYE